MAESTVVCYVRAVCQYAEYFGKSPDQLGSKHLRQYLLHLIEEKKVPQGTYNQKVAALRFFYRETIKQPAYVEGICFTRKKRKLQVVLSHDEVRRFLSSLDSLKYRAILMTCYGAGLRISETLSLKSTDIDSSRMMIRVRQGKGRKDRYVGLPQVLLRILRKYWKAAKPKEYLSLEQHRALRAIALCRTRALGGHVQQCDGCGHTKPSYNSCRNRHCPKCQASARAAWLEARAAELLPVPYFHLVFTLPSQLGPSALQNKQVVYGILFRGAWETVRNLAHDPKHLGAKVAMLSVLLSTRIGSRSRTVAW